MSGWFKDGGGRDGLKVGSHLFLPPTLQILSPPGHHSTVSIELQQESSGTKLTLLQTEVPDSDCEATKEGWKRHIFENIKSTFGYGAQLF